MGANSLINVHNHSQYSDGDYTPEQIVATAARKHLTHIAITDHFETTKVHSLRTSEFDRYLEEIRRLGQEYKEINVLAGVEIDTCPERCDLQALPIDLLNQLDVVLFEYVGESYGSRLDQLRDVLSQLKIPYGLAHTDIEKNFSAAYEPAELAEYFASYSVFVEVNTAWPYRRDGIPFYELAEKYYKAFKGKVKVSVGTDMHHVLSEIGNLDVPYAFLKKHDLLDDLVF